MAEYCYGNSYNTQNGVVFGTKASVKQEAFLGAVTNNGKEFTEDQFPYVSNIRDEEYLRRNGTNGWQKGHLIGKQFGGNNTEENLIPLTKEANLRMLNEVESVVKNFFAAGAIIKGQFLKQSGSTDTRNIQMVYCVKTCRNEDIVNADLVEIDGLFIPRFVYCRTYIEIGDNIVDAQALSNDDFWANIIKSSFSINSSRLCPAESYIRDFPPIDLTSRTVL